MRDAAGDLLADPSDLLAFAEQSELVDDDGEPDAEQIRAAAGELAEAKPHLAAKRAPAGDVGQRPRGDPAPGEVDLASIRAGLRTSRNLRKCPQVAGTVARVDRDRESLRLAVEDVGYELQQLVDLAREIDRQDDALRSRIPGALGYDVTAAVPIACLESALLHVRNLLAFYVRSKKSWITVKDYLPEWWPPESDALRRLRDRRDRLNAHLSHLTWERVTGRAEIGENPGWDVGELADDALTVFTGFVAQLQRDEPEAAEWFSGTLAVTSRTLRGEWPAILPKPAPGSPLAVRRPGIKRRPL